jgi:hypothetical protein
MNNYKLTANGIEMIISQEYLVHVQNRNWEYVEVDAEITHTIEEFMCASLNEIIINQKNNDF